MNDKYLKHLSRRDRVAVVALCELIKTRLKVRRGGRQPDEVGVYTYYDNPKLKKGLRVIEVSLAWAGPGGFGSSGSSGSSYMRSDVEAGAMILAAEEYVLNFYKKPFRPSGWSSDIDDKADAEWRLLYVLNGPEKPSKRKAS